MPMTKAEHAEMDAPMSNDTTKPLTLSASKALLRRAVALLDRFVNSGGAPLPFTVGAAFLFDLRATLGVETTEAVIEALKTPFQQTTGARNLEIRRRFTAGETLKALGAEFGISSQRVHQIVGNGPNAPKILRAERVDARSARM